MPLTNGGKIAAVIVGAAVAALLVWAVLVILTMVGVWNAT